MLYFVKGDREKSGVRKKVDRRWMWGREYSNKKNKEIRGRSVVGKEELEVLGKKEGEW